ncbi:TetR family transcriptional regulator C-terminal domain-containing protein [Nocardioides sp.]|uniref:TetR family transcriptional regulator C-terminal domain-containing protein n=1 Tax=Nocardioides sp. TaxID=35761 RepID=UPI0031FF0FC3|nr:hypothetical protein [Nocardioides sp.]
MELTGAFLPGDDDEVHDVVVWLGLLGIGANNPGVARALRLDAEAERDLLHRVTGGGLDEAGLDTLVAIIHGLRLAVCAPEAPMSVARAADLLDRYVRSRVTSAA